MGWFSFKPETTIFGNVQDEHLEEIRRMLRERAALVLPPGDAAAVEADGWDVAWSYNRAASELTITVNNKPKWPPMMAVRSALRKELAKYGIVEVERKQCGTG